MPTEKEILNRFLVDEKDIIEDLANLVEKATNIFVIEKSTGTIIFKNFGKLTDRQRISALLVGRYFAGRLDLIEDVSLGVTEMANALGRPKTTLSGTVRDMLSKTYIEQLSNRKYRVNYNRIKDILENFFDLETSSGISNSNRKKTVE